MKTIGRIPTTLMTELIGVPREMREEFIEMASEHLKAVAVTPDMDPEEVERLERLAKKFHGYIEELLAERRAAGATGDDLVSVIARSEIDGGPVPHSMALAFISFFINAGETTRALLSHMALCLAQHPEQRRLLVERPELVPNAIEETMRYYPIDWTHCRTAIERTEIAGQVDREGRLPDDRVTRARTATRTSTSARTSTTSPARSRATTSASATASTAARAGCSRDDGRDDDLGADPRAIRRLGVGREPETFSTPFIRGVISLPLRFSA